MLRALLTTIAVTLSITAAAHGGSWVVTQLTDNSYYAWFPQVSGDNVVWWCYDGSDDEIFLYDGATTTQLTDNSYYDFGTQVSGDNVVWGDVEGDQCSDSEIYMAYYAYALTVNGGSGGGLYAESTVVDIDADVGPSGQEFDEWVGDTSGIANVDASSTTLTMPPANVEVTATYAYPPVTYWGGDRNEDFFVGQTDLDIILDQWGNSGGEITDPRADANGDDFVGQVDLDYVLDDWGKSGSPPP